MAVRVRGGLFADDEELGKKDDDRRTKPGTWSARGTSAPWRKRRIAGLLLGCVALYFFVVNIPRDMGPVAARIRAPRPQYGSSASKSNRAIPKAEYNFDRDDVYPPELSVKEAHAEAVTAPAARQAAGEVTAATKDFSYDGPVKFYYLAGSLQNIKNIIDYRPGNRHVLFAASDLSSAASILPIACEMAGWKRNTVHFAIFGRDSVSIPDIMEANGAVGPSCPIYWHDARPDRGGDSTGPRMQLSVSGAMNHIVNYMLPQAVITADGDHENVYFATGMRRSVKAMALTHIEIPKAAPEKLAWLSRLDAGSLHSWHSAGVDVLVQAPLESSGSLIRLLHSLELADYAGFTPPRLTIELPYKIDQATQNFLAGFKWPPYQYLHDPTQPDELITRRRISEQHIDSDEASLRFVESFYPSSPKGPHILLLSPQAELSPVFFHYLKLHLLEYRYSLDHTEPYRNLFGISSETPTMYLNGTTRFVPPVAVDDEIDDGTYNPFRWQAPESNAALYFSDKWIEFHSFMTKRRTASLHSRTREHHTTRPKQVSQKQPAWVEYALDIMRTRGYSLHYPGLFSHFKGHADSPAQSLVIMHNELYQPPEEFTSPEQQLNKRQEVAKESSDDQVLTLPADAADYLPAHHPLDDQSQEINEERPLLRSLMPMLPDLELQQVKDPIGGQIELRPRTLPLPDLARIPLLDFTGDPLTSADLQSRAQINRITYRHLAGGCSDKAANVDDIQLGSAEDLFCLDDEDLTAETERKAPPTASAQPLAGAVTSNGEAAAPIADATKNILSSVKGAAANVAGAAAGAAAAAVASSEDTDLSRARRPVLGADDTADTTASGYGSVPAHPVHQSFEDEMAARDAAKTDRLNDRARTQDGKQAAAVHKMREATEADDEIESGSRSGTGRKTTGAWVGRIRQATEDDDEEVAATRWDAPSGAEGLDERDSGAAGATKTHTGPGDPDAPIPKLRATGAAAHVNAVEDTARYAETARAGFNKKTSSNDAAGHSNPNANANVRVNSPSNLNAAAPKRKSLYPPPKPHAEELTVPSTSNAQVDDEAEVDAESDTGAKAQVDDEARLDEAPTPTHAGPGDQNAPVPKLRATGAAAHVNAVEDTKRYAETARAGMLKKLGKET